MIDTQAMHDVLSSKLANEFVAPHEDLRVFGVDRHELVDSKEPPVVDLVVRRPPIRDAVMLLLEQLMQQVWVAVDLLDRLVHRLSANDRIQRRWGKWKVQRPAANVMPMSAGFDLNHALHQGLSIGFLQNRQEHPVAHETGQRTPVDVEEARRGTRWSITKDLSPERVALGIGSHVVGDDIEDDAHLVGAQGIRESLPCSLTAQLSIDTAVIDDVVAMRAARSRGVDGREIHMADTQPRYVRNLSGKIVERKVVR